MSAKQQKATKQNRQRFERTCVACRALKPKCEMLRIVKNKQEEFKAQIDTRQKLDGRGCYICQTQSCISLLVKKKAINRAFKCQIEDGVYQQLQACNFEV